MQESRTHDNREKKAGKKVFVGMSGGVDSSVSAALLKEQGYDVTGVFIKAWHPDFLTCTWKEDRRDAMRVCATLDIPFLTFDFEKEYKQAVIDYMLAEYAAGRTPNPDVMCNKSVKFGVFLKKALEMGADYVATGHYAQRVEGIDPVDETKVVYKLLESADTQKDQTYFIWTLTQKELAHILFPVGEYPKPQVRALAEKFNLPTFAKKDSQGLCFLGKVDLKEFLGHYFKNEAGNVLNEAGEVIGTHQGSWFYTLGERHGFSIEGQTPDEKPYYIVKKDIKNNTLTVAHREEHSQLIQPIQTISLEQVSWTHRQPENGAQIFARMRYRQELLPCKLIVKKGEGKGRSRNAHQDISVHFAAPQSIVSPGQSVVFYNNGECLGGAIIAETTTE